MIIFKIIMLRFKNRELEVKNDFWLYRQVSLFQYSSLTYYTLEITPSLALKLPHFLFQSNSFILLYFCLDSVFTTVFNSYSYIFFNFFLTFNTFLICHHHFYCLTTFFSKFSIFSVIPLKLSQLPHFYT